MKKQWKYAIPAALSITGAAGLYGLLSKDTHTHTTHPPSIPISEQPTTTQSLEEIVGPVQPTPTPPTVPTPTPIDPLRTYLSGLHQDLTANTYPLDTDTHMTEAEIRQILATDYTSSEDVFTLMQTFLEAGKLYDAATTLKLFGYTLSDEDPDRLKVLQPLLKNVQNELWLQGQADPAKYASNAIASYAKGELAPAIELAHLQALNNNTLDITGRPITQHLHPHEQRAYIEHATRLFDTITSDTNSNRAYTDSQTTTILDLFNRDKDFAKTQWKKMPDKTKQAVAEYLENNVDQTGRNYLARTLRTLSSNARVNNDRMSEAQFRAYITSPAWETPVNRLETYAGLETIGISVSDLNRARDALTAIRGIEKEQSSVQRMRYINQLSNLTNK